MNPTMRGNSETQPQPLIRNRIPHEGFAGTEVDLLGCLGRIGAGRALQQRLQGRVLFLRWQDTTTAQHSSRLGIAVEEGCQCIVLQSLPDPDAAGFWSAGGFKMAAFVGSSCPLRVVDGYSETMLNNVTHKWHTTHSHQGQRRRACLTAAFNMAVAVRLRCS